MPAQVQASVGSGFGLQTEGLGQSGCLSGLGGYPGYLTVQR